MSARVKFSSNEKESPQGFAELPVEQPSWFEATVLKQTPKIRSELYPTRKYSKEDRATHASIRRAYGPRRERYVNRVDCPYGTLSQQDDPTIPCIECYHPRKNKCLRGVQDLNAKYMMYQRRKNRHLSPNYQDDQGDDFDLGGEDEWLAEYDTYVSYVKELERLEPQLQPVKPGRPIPPVNIRYEMLMDAADQLLVSLLAENEDPEGNAAFRNADWLLRFSDHLHDPKYEATIDPTQRKMLDRYALSVQTNLREGSSLRKSALKVRPRGNVSPEQKKFEDDFKRTGTGLAARLKYKTLFANIPPELEPRAADERKVFFDPIDRSFIPREGALKYRRQKLAQRSPRRSNSKSSKSRSKS